METFSALLAICAGNSPVPQRPVTRRFDVSLICTRINGWVNNDEAGDLIRYRAHYDVTVMELFSTNLIYLKLGYDTITHQYHDFNGSFANKSHFDENMFENNLHKHTRLKPIYGIRVYGCWVTMTRPFLTTRSFYNHMSVNYVTCLYFLIMLYLQQW